MSSSAEHLASGVGEVHAGGLAWRLDGRLLGQGGFASVYAAVASDGTTAAVKLIDTRRLSAWATRQLEGGDLPNTGVGTSDHVYLAL